MKCVGGIIEVIHLNESIKRLFLIVQRNIDRIINLLLPIGYGLAVGHRQLAEKEQKNSDKLFQPVEFIQK